MMKASKVTGRLPIENRVRLMSDRYDERACSSRLVVAWSYTQ